MSHVATPQDFAGRFELHEEVGRGTQSVVYRAHDRATNDPVALKMYRGTTPWGGPDTFLQDVRTMATLASPYQVNYVCAGEHDGRRFLAMEWVPSPRGVQGGMRLSDYLSGKPLSLAVGLEVCKRVARALARIHRAGLVHGNLKPENVLVPEGDLARAKLSDILVNLWEPVRPRFDDRWFRGAMGFASWQVLRRGTSTPQDDCYALGALLFRCIAGCMPFPEHDDRDAKPLDTASRVPRRLARYIPSLWPEVQQLVDNLLEFDPSGRPEDATQPCLALYQLAHRLRSRETMTESDLDVRAPLPRFFDLAEPPPPAPYPRGFDPRLRLDPSVFERPPVGDTWPSERVPVPEGDPEIRLAEGEVFAGRYAIEALVGTGTTGTVYQARNRDSNDLVALRIHDGRASDEERQRFFSAMKQAAARYHPHLMHVVQTGTWEGRLFVAMDWISGETLEARLARQPLTTREAFTVMQGIAEGLAGLHRGAAQSNLRPRNVLLRNRNLEWVKLSDIGVWREGRRPEPSVEDAMFVAPEVLRSGEATFQGDLYALGVIAFRMLTGCLPFEAASLSELAIVRSRPAPALADLRPGAGPALCAFVDRLLRTDPEERPRDAVQALSSFPDPQLLGWGADDPPIEITRAADARRVPVLPARVPLDPFSDTLFQDFVERELQARCAESNAHVRLGRVAHAAAGPGPGTGASSCALCAHPGADNRALVELRDGGHFPVETFDLPNARQPAVCVPCLREPHRAAFDAVSRMLADYRGDSALPLDVIGPTRGEICAGVRALHEAAVPRVASGRCAVCDSTEDVVCGARIAVCCACLRRGAAAYDVWLAAAPARKAERVRASFDEMYRLAEERAGRRMDLQRAVKRGVDDLPRTAMWANGSSCAFSLQNLGAQKPPAQKDIDALADQFADTLLLDVHRALEGDPDVGIPYAIGENGYLAKYLSEFRGAYRPSPDKDERLRVAIAVMADGVRRGMQFYQKDDDNAYTHNVTPYFEDFKEMPVR